MNPFKADAKIRKYKGSLLKCPSCKKKGNFGMMSKQTFTNIVFCKRCIYEGVE